MEGHMSLGLGAIILGIINIAIVIASLLLVGAIILWFVSWMQMGGVPPNVQKGYICVVALIGLGMLVALLLGVPGVRIIGGRTNLPAVAITPSPPDIMVR
jgi:hypothetical protein